MPSASVKAYLRPDGGLSVHVRTAREIIEDAAAHASPTLAKDIRALERLLDPASVNRFERKRDELARGWLAKNLGNTGAARLIAEAKGTDPESERRAIRRERKRWDKKVKPRPGTRRD